MIKWLLIGGILFSLPACAVPHARRGVSPVRNYPPPAGQFQRPIDDPVILSRFGRRGRRFHEGIDLRVQDQRRKGDPVYASRAGHAVKVGRLGGYGRMILIQHSDGYYTRYAHLEESYVHQGEWLNKGQKIGAIGQSGRATGPHLHFEILTPGKEPINPGPFLFSQ